MNRFIRCKQTWNQFNCMQIFNWIHFQRIFHEISIRTHYLIWSGSWQFVHWRRWLLGWFVHIRVKRIKWKWFWEFSDCNSINFTVLQFMLRSQNRVWKCAFHSMASVGFSQIFVAASVNSFFMHVKITPREWLSGVYLIRLRRINKFNGRSLPAHAWRAWSQFTQHDNL